jgi:hypothetical protein
MRTDLQICDGFPVVKVEQISQGEEYVRVGVDLKHTNKILTVKMEQIKHKKRMVDLQNPDLKANVRIIIIIICMGEIDINLKWGDFSYLCAFITSTTKLNSYIF